MTAPRAAHRLTALLVALAALAAVALTASSTTDPTALITLATTAATTAALGIALATVAVRVGAPTSSRALRVGHRAHSHRESLDRLAAPAHPDTAGRPRSRAPGWLLRAA